MKTTQYAKIIEYLRYRQWATYRQLMLHCGTNWPHKRISELEERGYEFLRYTVEQDGRKHTLVRMLAEG